MVSWRELTLRVMVAGGAIAVVMTELLGALHQLRRGPLLAAWAVVILLAAWRWRPDLPPRPKLEWFPGLIALGCAAVAAIVGYTAWLSPPNSADAMSYHMVRILYWVQSASVDFFPTSYYNQVSQPPGAEYLMLHTVLLSGGDRYVNLIAFCAYAGSAIAVSLIARSLGLKPASQAFAALFAVTLPNAVLQGSGAKNDSLLGLWLAASVYFGLEGNAFFFALPVALALTTKATAFLFLPPLLVVVLWRKRQSLKLCGLTAAAILLLNGPQYARNIALSGSPLGFDSAQGDGFFRWRNERLGWKPTVSNALRHLSEQLGARSPAWNNGVYEAVLRAHRMLGIDPNDAATTWPWTKYEAPRNTNHEADANNRWHLLFLAAAAPLDWPYTVALFCAFLLFCAYLKWQHFMPRLELPLFVLGAPLAARLFERLRYPALQAIVCLFLLNNARPYLLENWTRPLKGPHRLQATSREMNYFSDMTQWTNRDSYLEAVRLTAATSCDVVGTDITYNHVEYPFLALVKQLNPRVRFVHADVPGAAPPCVVLCLDCAGHEEKRLRYAPLGPPVEVGRFLVFSSH